MNTQTQHTALRHQSRERDFGVGYGSSSGYASARRQREFGIGYGDSSGYASERRYTRDQMTQKFRVG